MQTNIIVDPLKKFSHLSEQQIMDTLGYLPGWVVNLDFYEFPLKDALEKQYKFGPLYQSEKAIIEKDGTYKYPSDPDMYPLIKIQRGDEIFYQYPHAMIAIVQKDDSSFASRMD